MNEYHVGCGCFEIYAGTLNKKGDRWKAKSVVTQEAMNSVAQFLLERDESMSFDYKGKRYKLCVLEVDNEQD